MATSRLVLLAALLPAALLPATLAAQSPASDSAEVSRAPFVSAGIAIGAPGAMNATLAWHDRDWTARVAGGLGGAGHSGVQGELTWHRWTAESLSMGPALIAGVYRSSGADAANRPDGTLRTTTFAGVALDSWLAGFRVQVGAGLGSGADPRVLLVQLGWEWSIARGRGGER